LLQKIVCRIAGVPPAKKGTHALKDRTRRRIAGVSPASGCTQPPMSEVEISTDFLFAYRQKAGDTPAIRWSVIRFKNDP
jgi:hypothetical protein